MTTGRTRRRPRRQRLRTDRWRCHRADRRALAVGVEGERRRGRQMVAFTAQGTPSQGPSTPKSSPVASCRRMARRVRHTPQSHARLGPGPLASAGGMGWTYTSLTATGPGNLATALRAGRRQAPQWQDSGQPGHTAPPPLTAPRPSHPDGAPRLFLNLPGRRPAGCSSRRQSRWLRVQRLGRSARLGGSGPPPTTNRRMSPL